MPLPIAISMGDPAGVGPELCLHALSDTGLQQHGVPVVFGDRSVLDEVADKLNQPFDANILSPEQWSCTSVDLQSPTIVDLQQLPSAQVVPGQVSATTGAAAYEYVRQAIAATQRGRVAALVTAPIHKEAFHAAGVPYPGHTELLAEMTACRRYCMMLTSDQISCSLVTTHVGLHEVSDLLTCERIVEVLELTDEALRRWLGRPSRLVVCGLNPHAGEHGLFGRGEEEEFIQPAIAAVRQRGLNVVGPLAPDTAFVPSRRDQTDAYICMYHDQGLIPLKALAFDTAINVTLGLPIIRSSVDHGTALDIAWQGRVDLTSFQAAFRWAARMAAASV